MDSNGNNFVTDSYKTPLIQIITWFLLASAIVCAVARFFTKYMVMKHASTDDYFILVSLVFLIGQSVVVTLQTTSGLGKQMADLDNDQIDAILKGQYASMLLYIPSLVFSKLPTLVLLNMISPLRHFNRFIIFTAALIAAWAVSSELVSAFRCHLPRAWDTLHGSCIPIAAFFTYFEAMNGFTEVLLMVMPFVIVLRVQSSVQKKASVLFVFCTRLLPLAAIIAKIVIFWQSLGSSDPIFDLWITVITTQVIQFLSFMASCMLYLRPFLESLSSGFMGGDDLRRRGQLRPYILQQGDLDMAQTESYAPGSSAHETQERGRGRSPRPGSLPGCGQRNNGRHIDADLMVETFSDGETTLRSEGPSRLGPGEAPSSAGTKGDDESRMSPVGDLNIRGRANLPTGANNLPRVSQIYTPLGETEAIASFLELDRAEEKAAPR